MTQAIDNPKFKKVIELIDEYNKQDPHVEHLHDFSFPKEYLYSQWLTDWVLILDPHASEFLRIAARGQHIGRWTIPRERFPMDRGGYLRWREELKKFHSEKVGEFMNSVGYSKEDVTNVQSMMLKKDIKGNADTQTLEDGLCLVFLEHQFQSLRLETPEEKMKAIVIKTWRKMSTKGQALALKIPLDETDKKFLEMALSGEH